MDDCHFVCFLLNFFWEKQETESLATSIWVRKDVCIRRLSILNWGLWGDKMPFKSFTLSPLNLKVQNLFKLRQLTNKFYIQLIINASCRIRFWHEGVIGVGGNQSITGIKLGSQQQEARVCTTLPGQPPGHPLHISLRNKHILINRLLPPPWVSLGSPRVRYNISERLVHRETRNKSAS